MNKDKEINQVEDIQSRIFAPVVFVILTCMWFMLFFDFFGFYTCSLEISNIYCFSVQIIFWMIWLMSSSLFVLLCIYKTIKERKPIDILILLEYGALYWFTLEYFFF